MDPRAFFLCVLASLGAGSDGPEDTGSSRVELRVSAGRAALAEAGRVSSVAPSSPPRGITGLAYVETPALTELELRWPGAASARIVGSAAFHVDGAERLELLRFQSVEVEARRGRFGVELPHGLSLELSGAALRIATSSEGSVVLFHRGGSPAVIRKAGSGIIRTLHAGEELRLGAAPTPVFRAAPTARPVRERANRCGVPR